MPVVHCEWGLHGMETLREHVAVLIVVDVLSFSTAVDIAVARGAEVFPYASGAAESTLREAQRHGALLAESRSAGAQLSLSPASLRALEPGQRIVLPSPNGSRLSLAGGPASVLAGSLRNRRSVARRARELAGDRAIGVVPAGERWPDGSLRPAIEDWLGAGALIAALDLETSAEASLARAAFEATQPRLPALIRGCQSGQELIDRGFATDVQIATELDISDVAPRLRDGRYASE